MSLIAVQKTQIRSVLYNQCTEDVLWMLVIDVALSTAKLPGLRAIHTAI